MKPYLSKIRVRYGETDQMGVVHHGNYAQYLELARIEWLQQFGISYKSMERNGVMLPVYEMNIKFRKPAFFDDLLFVETNLLNKPQVKIEFAYSIRNESEELLTTARTVLVFTDAQTKKPICCPDYILKTLAL